MLSSSQLETTNGKKSTDIPDTSGNLAHTSIINEEPPKSRQRLIPVDFSLFQVFFFFLHNFNIKNLTNFLNEHFFISG